MTTTAMAHVQCNMIVLRFALVTLLCFSCLLAGVGSQNLSSRDMAGLQALWEAWKNNTLHPAENLANWGNFSSNPCGDASENVGWRGVTCASFSTGAGRKKESSVINLDLSNNPGLSGLIPKEIGQFTNLQVLNLDNNQGLFGPLPEEIGRLRNLQVLDLGKTAFTGRVPDISNLTFLQLLDLSQSNFTSHVPDISKLTNLSNLDLSKSTFTGPVSDISNLTLLKYLDLSWSTFMGPVPDISNLTQLQDLDLSWSTFTGPVPDISNLTFLQYLNLSWNTFSGPVPDISNLTFLQYLDLSRSNFTSHISDISKLTNLINLALSWSNFIGTVPDLSNLNQLQYLDLSKNNFTGQVPDTSNLIHLISLDLSNNRLTCPLPNFTNSPYTLNTLDLSNNKFSCATPDFTSLVNVTNLNLSSNRFQTWNSPDEFASFTSKLPPNVSVLDLSKLGISRHVPNQWSSVKLSQLSELYLDENNLTGILNISAFVGTDISRSLKVLSLKNNAITNVLTSDDYILAGLTKILLQGNPYCKNVWTTHVEASRCNVYCKPETCDFRPPSNNSWKKIVMAISISITGSAVVLMMVILGFVFILHRNRKYIRALQRKIKEADINARRFEYDELRAATRNFAPELKLGSGAYGAVYKGILSNDVVVAVKQLFLETDEGRDDFVNEVLLIANLQHRNLVTLKGYCLHGKQTLLVYEYVDNCDLDRILLSRQADSADSTAAAASVDVPVLSWQARLSICQGVAQGLYYLHASSQSRIIHRDIKASNILLDKNLQPKIADFGLARPIEDAQSVVMTQKCAGTFGYLAPEYMFHGQLSDKADVFSFGVLLLEIVSGKRNRDISMPEDEVYLPSWAWKLHRENRLLDMKDPTVVVSEDEAEEVRRVLETAVLCVQSAPEKRPSMFLVAAMLAGSANVDVAPVEDCDDWPDRRILDEYDSEFGPLFTSSSSSGPAPPCGRSRATNSNALVELSKLQKSKSAGLCDEENPRHGYTL